MRRIRIALALVSLATLGLVALLASRASQGLAAERAVRHEAVAERAFEEMERALSDFLAREEARPFEHYAHTLATSGERSPLASGLEPFVVGAFQIDPDGAVTTPLEPAEAGPARAAAERVRDAVSALWESADRERREADAGAPAREPQAPGTTRVLSGPGVQVLRERAMVAQIAAKPEEESLGAYDALESLNRAADDRAERKQKVAEISPTAVYGAPSSPSFEVGAARSDLADPSAPSSAASARPSADRAKLRIAVDPMVGVEAEGGALVLYRTALVAHRAYRQGLVIDRAALAEWLDDRVIRSSGLGRVAAVRFDADPIGDASGRYVFSHRFAEPFDALQARLLLASLPGVASPVALYALIGVLLAVGAAGIFSVHRTAAVAVQYAERRANFAAAVTHELKTPLTAIRMYAEMLRDDLVPSEAKRREYYATITGESERLSRLVDNVLEFSKLAGGRRELAMAVGTVGPVLEEAAAKLAPHAASEGFAISVYVDEGLPAVRFDRDALLQVLFNLVDNAMKYARAGERRTVVLEARREGGAVSVAVRDFGPGVARVHLERVFEPFYRGESELTRTARGTGIGLALVKELAERMGAAVSGTNAEGGGFRVRLAFPIA